MNIISSVTKKTEMHYGPAHQELFCFDISVLNSKVICIAIHIIFNETFFNIIVIHQQGKFCVYLLGALTSHERETWLERCDRVLCRCRKRFGFDLFLGNFVVV